MAELVSLRYCLDLNVYFNYYYKIIKEKFEDHKI